MELIELTSHAMGIYLALLPIIGFQTSVRLFSSGGQGSPVNYPGFIQAGTHFHTLVTILPRFWGIEGVWRTAPIADALSITLTATLIHLEMKKLGKEPADPELEGAVELSATCQR